VGGGEIIRGNRSVMNEHHAEVGWEVELLTTVSVRGSSPMSLVNESDVDTASGSGIEKVEANGVPVREIGRLGGSGGGSSV